MQGVHPGFVLAGGGQTNGSQAGTQVESHGQTVLDFPGNLPGIL